MPGTTSVATAGGTIGGGVAQVTSASALAAEYLDASGGHL